MANGLEIKEKGFSQCIAQTLRGGFIVLTKEILSKLSNFQIFYSQNSYGFKNTQNENIKNLLRYFFVITNYISQINIENSVANTSNLNVLVVEIIKKQQEVYYGYKM